MLIKLGNFDFVEPVKSPVPLYNRSQLEMDKTLLRIIYSARLPVSRDFVFKWYKAGSQQIASKSLFDEVSERLIILHGAGLIEHRIEIPEDFAVSMFWRPGNPETEPEVRKRPLKPYSFDATEYCNNLVRVSPKENPLVDLENKGDIDAETSSSDDKEDTSRAVKSVSEVPKRGKDADKCEISDAELYALVNTTKISTYAEIITRVSEYQGVKPLANYRRSLFQKLKRLVKEGYLTQRDCPSPYGSVYYGPALMEVDEAIKSFIKDTKEVFEVNSEVVESVPSETDLVNLGSYRFAIAEGKLVVLDAETNEEVSLEKLTQVADAATSLVLFKQKLATSIVFSS